MEPDVACALLEKIRARPAMYLGEKDLTRLKFLLDAFDAFFRRYDEYLAACREGRTPPPRI